MFFILLIGVNISACGQSSSNFIPSNYESVVKKLKDSLVTDNASQLKNSIDGDFAHTYKNRKKCIIGSFRNGKKTSYWAYFNTTENVILSEHYINGNLQGKQKFYANDKVFLIVPYLNNVIHGTIVGFDSAGHANLNLFFIHGKEVEDRTIFNKQFYTNSSSIGQTQVINLDETSVSSPIDSFEKRDSNILNFRKFMNSIDSTTELLGVNKYQKILDADYFLFYNKSLSKIIFNMHTTNDGIYIKNKLHDYIPMDNEILFLLEQKGDDISGQQIGFVLGNKIKTELQNWRLDYEQIIRFINNRLFYKNPIESWRLSKALQKAYKK
jgi:antitoxin component YwqK of YwqJK toxin-antitoxin module